MDNLFLPKKIARVDDVCMFLKRIGPDIKRHEIDIIYFSLSFALSRISNLYDGKAITREMRQIFGSLLSEHSILSDESKILVRIIMRSRSYGRILKLLKEAADQYYGPVYKMPSEEEIEASKILAEKLKIEHKFNALLLALSNSVNEKQIYMLKSLIYGKFSNVYIIPNDRMGFLRICLQESNVTSRIEEFFRILYYHENSSVMWRGKFTVFSVH